MQGGPLSDRLISQAVLGRLQRSSPAVAGARPVVAAVFAGMARRSLKGEVRLVTEKQAVYIPREAIHWAERPCRVSIAPREVQTGPSLREDDVARDEDVYARDLRS